MSDAELDTVLPECRAWLVAEREYAIPYSHWTRVIQTLGASVDVETLALAAGRLPAVTYHAVSGRFRRIAVPKKWRPGGTILFYSPNRRMWRRVPLEGDTMLVREGWTLLLKAEGQRSRYFVVTSGPTTEWERRPLDAIMCGYEGAVAEHAVKFEVTDGIAVVPHSRLVIPPPYVEWLGKMCVVASAPPDLWLWDARDLPLLRTVLRALRIVLEESSGADGDRPGLTRDFVEVLRGSYATALASEKQLEQFSLRSRTCDVEWFPADVRSPLTSLLTATFKGDHAARSLTDYISRSLSSSIEWRDSGDLDCVIADSSEVSWGGESTDRTDHLLLIPSLGSWATTRTRTLKVADARRHSCIRISHYRVLPFFGRLRITPHGVVQPRTDADCYDLAWRSLLGLPGLEAEITPTTAPYAFTVSLLEPTDSTQTNVGLERVIGVVAQVVGRGTAELDLPALVCQDPLGRRFILETTDLQPSQVPARGSHVRFIARRAWTHAGAEALYALILPRMLESIGEELYAAAAVTALVKTYRRVNQDEVVGRVGETGKTGIRAAVENGWLDSTQGRLDYRYPGASDEEQRALRAGRKLDVGLGAQLQMLLPRLHPLYGWLLTDDSNVRGENVRMRGTPAELAASIEAAVDEHGHAFVAALGRDRMTLVFAVQRLGMRRPDLRFERSDDSFAGGSGPVERTQYRVRSLGLRR